MSDLISRQAAIDALEWKWAGKAAFDAIKKLPSVEVEPVKHRRWIPVSERPPEDLEEVNVTWVNHDPEPYYNFVKDKRFTATAVCYKGKWYWSSSTCADVLAEYGRNPNEEIDDGIEIIAWMPLPEPYKDVLDSVCDDYTILPSAERRGRWIEEVGGVYCSCCWDGWAEEDSDMAKAFNFCPNCGAKMDTGEGE